MIDLKKMKEKMKMWKYNGHKRRINNFVIFIKERYPETKIVVSVDDKYYNIYHNKKHSDPSNKEFFDVCGEMFYEMFVSTDMDDVIFVYQDFTLLGVTNEQVSS